MVVTTKVKVVFLVVIVLFVIFTFNVSRDASGEVKETKEGVRGAERKSDPTRSLDKKDLCEGYKQQFMTKKKRVLVTGGAGFIGHALLRRLGKEGHFAVGLDSFNNYYSPKLKYARAANLSDVGFEVVKGSVCDGDLLNELHEMHQFTHVVHLAAYAGPRYSVEDPQTYIRENVLCSVELFEQLAKWKNVKLVFASTSSVYGDTAKTSEDSRTMPPHPYGASKVAVEALAQAYYHLYGLASVCVRFFTVYGPWGRPDAAVYLFTKQVDYEDMVQLYNMGECERSFSYIDDVIDGVMKLLDLVPLHPVVFNLGFDESIKVPRLLNLIETAVGKKADTCYINSSADAKKKPADLTKARTCLDYSPKVPIEEGVTRFVEWYRQYSDPEYVSGEFMNFKVVDRASGEINRADSCSKPTK